MSSASPGSPGTPEPSGAPKHSQDAVDRVLEQIASGACRFAELHFTDVAGAVKSVGLPAAQIRDVLQFGHWFDGSALEGGGRMMETDLLLQPDLATWGILPWAGTHGEQTARVLCDVQTPDGDPFPADPRWVLRRQLLEAHEMGLQYSIASEVEFFLFRANGRSTSAAEYLAAGPADTGGYFDLAAQQGGHVRDEIVRVLSALGVGVEASHHEIAPGQHEIDLPLLPALAAADAVITCKYVVKTIARQRGLVATFMPKPVPQIAGSGLHLHQVLLDTDGASALASASDEHGLSALGQAFIAGQLAHARAMCAVLAPTVNSYKRIGRGFDAPSYLVWSHSNPVAVIRVPRPAALRRPLATAAARQDPNAMRIELRCPDPSCNPYLAFAAALAAGLDGIRKGMPLPAPAAHASVEAGPALDESQVEVLPASLGEALSELDWNPVVRDALGAPVYERLLAAKEQEWQEYRRQVSAWELERYFETA